MIDENGRIVMPGQFDPTKTRARSISPRERFALTGRIDARPQNPRYMAGLSNFYALQNRGIPAFADARRPGMSAGEIAEDAERMGYRIGAQGLAPSRERNIAAAKAAGTFEELRQKYNRENPDKVMDDAGNIKAADKTKAGGVAAPRGSATARAGRGALPDDRPSVASANARQRFFGGMQKPPAAATVTPSPAPAPTTTVTPPPAVETPAMRRQMLRDAAMGRSETRDSSGRLTGIQSGYGTGSVKFFKPGEARPVSMTTDEFGKPETMKSFLARRKAIQASKGFV